MPPKNHKSGSAKYNVLSTRVDDTLVAEVQRKIGRRSVSAYLKELIEKDCYASHTSL